MSSEIEKTDILHKYRFTNKRNIDWVVGIEPLGLYYSVPPEKEIEIHVYLPTKPGEELLDHIYVEEDCGLTLNIWSVDITVYLDHEKVYW